MNTVAIGANVVLECNRCEGIWVDVDALQQIAADREKQAFASSVPDALNQPLELEKAIRYVPCPVCHELMNRIQFARCSHVIVDVCKPHGTWFDKYELQRAVHFIRAGGLDKARSQQLEQIKDEERRLAVAQMHQPTSDTGTSNPAYNRGYDIGSSAIGLLFDLFR
jgi:Zn-finger nucleic acid-binding protein